MRRRGGGGGGGVGGGSHSRRHDTFSKDIIAELCMHRSVLGFRVVSGKCIN